MVTRTDVRRPIVWVVSTPACNIAASHREVDPGSWPPDLGERPEEESLMGRPSTYPPEFQGEPSTVVFVGLGRTIKQVAGSLGVIDGTLELGPRPRPSSQGPG